MSADAICPVCPHHCRLKEGMYGLCRARKNEGGSVVCANYGKLTSIALDPIEKKPLAFFHPGSRILSVVSFGCNLKCPFCQNHEIAASGEDDIPELYRITPERLCEIAENEIPSGNIGVAYTYNEALVGYEFVRDTAELIRKKGMKNVLVTNGFAEQEILSEILPFIDAMNIDLKCFSEAGYEKLGGDLKSVLEFIKSSAASCHVELTTLIVPGISDLCEDMEKESAWIASVDPDIPLHITRYFPRHKMTDKATDISLMNDLKIIAERKLNRVLLGNV